MVNSISGISNLTAFSQVIDDDSDDDSELDEQYLVLPPSSNAIHDPNNDITPEPFVSSKLVEKNVVSEKENLVYQEYFRITSSSEYKENPRAYVQQLIQQRKNEKNEKWMFPKDDVLEKLKQEHGI